MGMQNGWRKMFGSGVRGLLMFLLAGCASLGVDRAADLARTWEEARVLLPNTRAILTPANVPARDPLPTVLYVHGCGGIYGIDVLWAETLSTEGYAVIMPDSFAREYRPVDCDPRTATGGLFLQAFDMREEEIEYALARLRTLPWVDQRNLFLMGHSEGGGAVALWRWGGFKAHIIDGWKCTHRTYPPLDGVRAPLNTAVLAINYETDPWFRGPMAGSCASKFGGRKDAREMILPGGGHGAAGWPEAREAVFQFLRDHTSR